MDPYRRDDDDDDDDDNHIEIHSTANTSRNFGAPPLTLAGEPQDRAR